MKNIFVLGILAVTTLAMSCSMHTTKHSSSVALWDKLELDFNGPSADEKDEFNPFLSYRLDVEFTSPSGKNYTVPGFFAADGKAGESSATQGNVWRVRFSPSELGNWRYQASFKKGDKAAIYNADLASAGYFDGERGGFTVVKRSTPLPAKSFKHHGKLSYVNQHYLQFQGSQKYFLKAGVNSPEVLLGYKDFDATPSKRDYQNHVKDWKPGNPTWQNGKGKGLIGLSNYVASLDNNSMYFLLMSTDGDGKETWPWVGPYDMWRYDVSKLAQWSVVFDHMIDVGIMPHFVLTETENEHFFEWYENKKIGGLADSRKLYYRELAARFGYLLAVTWNVGEENGWADKKSTDYGTNTSTTTAQRLAFADHLKSQLWYPAHIVIHNGPSRDLHIFNKPNDNIAGHPAYTGASLQSKANALKSYDDVLELRKLSASTGHPWVVSLDEPYENKKTPQALDVWRKHNVFASLMAGGAGTEFYLGGGLDLKVQDLRPYEPYYQTMADAIAFFNDHVPFWDMSPVEDAFDNAWLLQKPGHTYLLYFPEGGSAELELPAGNFKTRWYSPAEKAFVQGSVSSIKGGGKRSLGLPQGSSSQRDWLCIVERI